MDHRRLLRADCTRCAGLCCVSLSFDRSEWFAFDKGADVPCRNLSRTNTCTIFGRLCHEGQAGCAHYDCHGAGQRVTEELFAGFSWRSDADRARSMFDAFRALTHVHELRWLLHEATRLELTPEQEARRAELLAGLEPANGFTAVELQALDIDPMKRAVMDLLRD